LAGKRISFVLLLVFLPLTHAQDLKLGMIGLDTSHTVEFTRILNDASSLNHVTGARVIAAFAGGSPDIPASADRLSQFTAEVRDKWKVEIVDSIPELLKRVDGVLLMSVDGRPHLEQVKPVIAAHKPVFIDKPLAASLKDVREIFRLCKEAGVPCFSASSLRFYAPVLALRTAVGDVLGVEAYSPATLEPHHPDLFWYGVHGVEILYTLMGTGCQWVERTYSEDQEVTVGQWKDGRIGVFRGTRKGPHGYGATVFGSKATRLSEPVSGNQYRTLVEEIVRFLKTGTPPVKPEETLEMYTFMAAAQLSRERGGARVKLSEVQ
jgi:predicted dehydrogenase